MSDAILNSAAPSPEKNLPTVNVELRQDQTDQVAGLTPGMQIKVTMTGKVTNVGTRQPYDPGSSGFVGDLSFEMDSVKIEEDESGSMTNLLDD